MPTFPQFPNTGPNGTSRVEQRKGARFPISPTFPLKAVLSLGGRGNTNPGFGSPRPKPPAGKEWTATLIELSAKGARLHLSVAAIAFPEDTGWMTLGLGTYQLEIPCTVAHFRSLSRYALCGLQLDFQDATTEKAYLQLLAPVVIGTSLVPVEAKPNPSGRPKEQYAGKDSALLTIWRPAPGGPVNGFDFRMNRTGVRWRGGAELNTYGVEERPATARPALKLKLKTPETSETTPTVPLNETQDEEVRWQFCLAVSNLAPAVAADVRKFLQSLVVA